MLYEINLKIKEYANLSIYVDTIELANKLINNDSVLKRTIPITDVSVLPVKKENIKETDSVIIVTGTKKDMHYDKENNKAILSVPNNELRIPDLIYIALVMFSKKLSEQKKFLIHSSSLLCPSNKGIVLVGEANAGKTSLAYELMSKYNYKLISNDHSIIAIEKEKPMILGGTKEIQMRLGAIELYFPELYKELDIETEDKWNKKIIVNNYINQDWIMDVNHDEVPLLDVFSINTSETGNPFLRKKNDIDEFLFLYESMSRIMKGTYNYITGFNYPMPSIENENNLNDLGNLCQNLIQNCNVYEAKGSVKDVAKALVKKYE